MVKKRKTANHLIETIIQDWRCGSSSGASVFQVLEFKPQNREDVCGGGSSSSGGKSSYCFIKKPKLISPLSLTLKI
jgi:hypothetical protein